jgi:hypothetical protein
VKIVILNAQNLFLLDTPSKRYQYNKPVFKVIELAKAIKEIDPQIIMIMEVGGDESLQNFNKNYLDDNFIPSLIKGNSDRGIELGYLVKRNMPFCYDHYTHKNRPLNFNYPFEKKENQNREQMGLPPLYKSHKFSRDIAELRIYSKDDKNIPKLILLLVHLKSQLDFQNCDKNGKGRREAELKVLIEVYLNLEKKFKHKVPIIIGGDFNGKAQSFETDLEFKTLYDKTTLKDILELINLPIQQRTTLILPPSKISLENPQYDYIFIPQSFEHNVDKGNSGLYRYKNPQTGVPLPYPHEDYDLKDFPSDHYPLVLKLKKF